MGATISKGAMTDETIREQLSKQCDFGQFECRPLHGMGTLFLAAHRLRPRLLITKEARDDYPELLPRAVGTAVELLEDGGDVVIRRHANLDDLQVVREPIPRSS